MDYMNTEKMFKNTILKISDYFTYSDIPKVYHYFDYYNIAKVKNVTYYDHVESEYNIEDKQFYGYAIIEIEEWYNNNSAKFFYNAISENKGKIVYDDPYYWDVEFYFNEEKSLSQEKDDKELQNDLEEYETKYNVVVKDENFVFDDEVKEEEQNEEDQEDEDKKIQYEFYKKYDNRSKNNKKQKYSSIIENLKAENNDLRQILIKKQKNYRKNNKSKDKKSSWYRRLRPKMND